MNLYGFWSSEDGRGSYPGLGHLSFIVDVPEGQDPMEYAIHEELVAIESAGFYNWAYVGDEVNHVMELLDRE